MANKSRKVTIYNNVAGCDAKDDTTYRIITGASSGTCYTFDRNMPGTDCAEYTRGGWGGPGGCTSGSLLPKSALQKNGNGPACTFYSKEECGGSSTTTVDVCVDGTAIGLDTFASFRCS
ncbi:hypothetical protein QBC37DRAFT_463747 [Rhypophila decipiens]|uniref:Secreted LysM effector LysM C-terminal domain-containing protein n=1 Tax=Rhypophila decipiens TaxID=261697 RepID=A0AAN6Y8X9_9PEZI|nr:hypothetical protein QBC37DRAFT_463747 [Rhypophila decipiens]